MRAAEADGDLDGVCDASLLLLRDNDFYSFYDFRLGVLEGVLDLDLDLLGVVLSLVCYSRLFNGLPAATIALTPFVSNLRMSTC